MMLHGLRRVGTSAAVMTMLGASVIATGGTANAAISDCPTNNVCIWSGQNFVDLLWYGNGTVMADNPNTFYQATAMNPSGSTDNTTLGRFCTYNVEYQLTNILNPKTSGNISNSDTYFIKKC
jgi:hypothetical protein